MGHLSQAAQNQLLVDQNQVGQLQVVHIEHEEVGLVAVPSNYNHFALSPGDIDIFMEFIEPILINQSRVLNSTIFRCNNIVENGNDNPLTIYRSKEEKIEDMINQLNYYPGSSKAIFELLKVAMTPRVRRGVRALNAVDLKTTTATLSNIVNRLNENHTQASIKQWFQKVLNIQENVNHRFTREDFNFIRQRVIDHPHRIIPYNDAMG